MSIVLGYPDSRFKGFFGRGRDMGVSRFISHMRMDLMHEGFGEFRQGKVPVLGMLGERGQGLRGIDQGRELLKFLELYHAFGILECDSLQG